MDNSTFLLCIKRSLLLGLAWVSEHLHEFRIPIAKPGSFSKEDLARLKPLSELALTIWILSRCRIKLPVLQRISEWLWHESDNGRELIRLLLARNDFLPCCAFYTPLYQLGYQSTALNSVLKMLSRMDMATVLPLQPWSRLALDYNMWKLGLLHESKIRKRGLYLMAFPEPWVVSGEIAYSITHEVFYLSDFGFKPFHDARVLTYLETWIPYWSDIFTHENNYDLTGELSMVWQCMGGRFIASCEHPILPVLENQNPDGSILGPEGAGSYLYSNQDLPTRRRFLKSYHTTLVLLMATAMILHKSDDVILTN